MKTKINKAVFIDKDGTLIDDIPYNVKPERIRFKEDAMEALKLLQTQGFRLIVISNQPGIAHGYFSGDDMSRLADYLRQQLRVNGIWLTGFFYCPHHPEGVTAPYAMECDCRKPKPGLFFRAGEEWNLDLSRCWMIGDILDDVEAGHRAGCRSILIDNGGEDQWLKGEYREPDFTSKTLLAAAQYILSNDQTRY